MPLLQPIPSNSVTNAQLVNVATGTVKGRTTSGTGSPEDITLTALATALQPYLTAGGFGPVIKPYAQSGATQTVTAGAAVAQSFTVATLPALGINAQIRLVYKAKKVGVTNNWTINVKLGGTSMMGAGGIGASTTSLIAEGMVIIQNKASASSQLGQAATYLGLSNQSTLAASTGAVDTSVAGVALTMELTRASTSDTISLESYSVEIYDPDATIQQASEFVNAQTGTSYTILAADWGKLITQSNASASAYTLPQAGTTFPHGWWIDIQNTGAGTLTVTPTTSTIDGAATLALLTGQGARLVSDGTNYRARITLTATGAGGATTPQDEAAGRALVQDDSTKVLGSTAATAQAFSIPSGLTTPWETRIEKFGAGNVTVSAPSGITLNGVDAGSTIITAQYTGVTIRARSATAFYVVA